MNTTEWLRVTKGLNFLKDGVSSGLFRVGGLIGILSRGNFGREKSSEGSDISVERIRVELQ